MYLVRLLLLLCLASVALGVSCNAVGGEHSDCACTMDDGSGTVDISSYANTDQTARYARHSEDIFTRVPTSRVSSLCILINETIHVVPSVSVLCGGLSHKREICEIRNIYIYVAPSCSLTYIMLTI